MVAGMLSDMLGSFVRSNTMDTWKQTEIRKMEVCNESARSRDRYH